MGVRFFVAASVWILAVALSSGQQSQRVYVVSHGWHTGIVVPLDAVDRAICPALNAFEGWEYVEIGWGDEGFYRGGDSISLGAALKTVATPTPTVLHVVGARAPVEDLFTHSALVSIDVGANEFQDLVAFVGGTFEVDVDGMPIDLGEGIYGHSRFFRARGSYYFPKTCNVWTVEALGAAGLGVFPAAGIRAENVMNQAARHGVTIRAHERRSRIAVLLAVIVAAGAAVGLRKKRRFVWIAWGTLLLGAGALAGVTMASVNRVAIPGWLPAAAAWGCWAAIGFVAAAHWIRLAEGFLWRHLVPALVAGMAVIVGLSPL